MKKLVLLIPVLLTLLALLGCHSTPVVNTFMDPDVSVQEHAVLMVDNNINIAMIDGQMTLKSSGKGTDGAITSKSPRVLLTPGEHRIDLQYLKQTSNSNISWNNTVTVTTTTEQTDFIPFTADFKGGHFYRVYATTEGSQIVFHVDEDSQLSWESKEFQNIKYPKKIATLLVIQRAAAESPTPLEGTYVLRDNPDLLKYNITEQAYTFSGKTFVVRMTMNYTDAQLKQQNAMRKFIDKSAAPLTSNTLYSFQRGTIEAQDNKVVLSTLQMSQPQASPDSGSAIYTTSPIAPPKYTFNYSFTPEGNLRLGTVEDDRAPVYIRVE
jgi:hypothetical protein